MNRTVKIILITIAALGIFLQSCVNTPPTVKQNEYQISISEVVATGLNRPVAVTHANDGSDRLFVVEQIGLIRVLENGIMQDDPLLDIQSLVSIGSEQGLLGLAFHPDYLENGFFYINYTDKEGATNVVRYTISKNRNIGDAYTAFQILTIPQPYVNHNGGSITFGPDGYLYIGMGDGGSANDPLNNAQNLSSPLGKLLRIDINSQTPYQIPDDNPFNGISEADPRIWAFGLRNPWRFGFDRLTGDLYIGDVGQNKWEEINFQWGESAGGENYGWVCKEAAHTNQQQTPCDEPDIADSLIDPILEYDHRNGQSITGGYVYRGKSHLSLQGIYFYADFVSGKIWSVQLLDREKQIWSQPKLEIETGFNVSSFGEDENGEIYIVDYSGGTIRMLAVK